VKAPLRLQEAILPDRRGGADCLAYTTQTGVYTYQSHNAGNLTNASEPSGRQLIWNYDGINRLTQESISSAPTGKNGNLAYGLDPVGNRTSATSISGLAPISGTFNLDDELSSEGYSDGNGNVTSAVTVAGSKTFAYDSENHLISMGSTVALHYDGDGNRVAKTVGATTTWYLVDDLNPTGYPQVVEELTNGAASRTYTYGLQRISEYQQIQSTWTGSFYQYDGEGSVRQLTSAVGGAVTDRYEYDAFGNEFTVPGGSSTPNEMYYRGEQYDSDLGLYYLRARYYNPLTGRFMSGDPDNGSTADPKTLHKYLYTGGDPVDGWDPTGRSVAVGYAQFTRWDATETFLKAAVMTGVIDCMFESILTRFDGAIETAANGGSIAQTGPCVWIIVNLAKALPKSDAPPQAIPGTKVSPWTPQCDELRDATNAAKAAAKGMECIEGLHPKQLQKRHDLWIALAVARQAYNETCWNGGDGPHQDITDDAWDNAEYCSELLESF